MFIYGLFIIIKKGLYVIFWGNNFLLDIRSIAFNKCLYKYNWTILILSVFTNRNNIEKHKSLNYNFLFSLYFPVLVNKDSAKTIGEWIDNYENILPHSIRLLVWLMYYIFFFHPAIVCFILVKVDTKFYPFYILNASIYS